MKGFFMTALALIVSIMLGVTPALAQNIGITISTIQRMPENVFDVAIITGDGEQQIQDNTSYTLSVNRPEVKSDGEVLPMITGRFTDGYTYQVTQKNDEVAFTNAQAGVTYRRS